MTVDFSGVTNMKNCVLGISVCLWPISKCWWLPGTTMKVGLVIQAHQPQPLFSPWGGIGASGPIKEKKALKVCFWGILSNSTIFRWQILQQRFFSHHTKIFRAFCNWKSPREHILWKKILNLVTKNYMGYIKLLHQSTMWKTDQSVDATSGKGREWRAKSCSSRGWAHGSQSIVMREFSSRWFAKLEISGLDGRREMSFLVVYFCNSGHVSKKSTKSETGPWLHLQIKKKRKSKETFSMQNFLFRNKNINKKVTWKNNCSALEHPHKHTVPCCIHGITPSVSYCSHLCPATLHSLCTWLWCSCPALSSVFPI